MSVQPPRVGYHYHSDLTNAEASVLSLVGKGMSNAEIGAALFICPDTVRTHVKRLHDKLDIHGRARLAIWAYKNRHDA